MTPSSLEKLLDDCCERELVSATYHQIDNQDDIWPTHDIHPEIGDFCDLGVSLVLDDNSVAYIAWDGTFCQYGLMLTRTPVSKFAPEGKAFPRTGSRPWKSLISDPISSASVIWTEFHGDLCPQAFHFKFSSARQLVLSAAQPMKQPDGNIDLFGVSDWVAILHQPDIIERHLEIISNVG